ncbi:MAG: hypothetical protein GY851_00065 [bacterium]|nr:hypothetical protein [bacterium]
MSMICLMSIAQGMTLCGAASAGDATTVWHVGQPVFAPGPTETFDDRAVKDPTVVYVDKQWHVFYTARGQGTYSIGYVAAPTLESLQDAPRHRLDRLMGSEGEYAAAPQVFYFAPRSTWYLIYQTRASNYQPAYSTTKTIGDPSSWSPPANLVEKHEREKWIDFWVICDDTTAYLFYTRSHKDLFVMTTSLDTFPNGFGSPKRAFGPVHEAVHIYKAKGLPEYHMLYEMRTRTDHRRFGLATAPNLAGPWTNATDEYATGTQLRYPEGAERWTDEVSHGEFLRTGFDQRLEYDADRPRLLIQGMPLGAHEGEYADLAWWLGVIEREREAE